MRDAWPEVLASLQRTKRSAWMVALTAQVREYRTDDDVLVLASRARATCRACGGPGNQSLGELLRSAILEVLGVTVKFLPRRQSARNAGRAEAGRAAAGGRAPIAGAVRRIASAQPARARRQAVDTAAATTPEAAATGPEGRRPRPTASTANGRLPPPRARAGAGPVDSWATIAIPREPAPEAEAARGPRRGRAPRRRSPRRRGGRSRRPTTRRRRQPTRRQTTSSRRSIRVPSPKSSSSCVERAAPRGAPPGRTEGRTATYRDPRARDARGDRRRHPALRRVGRARGARRDVHRRGRGAPAAPASGSAGSPCTKASSKS